MYSRPTYSGNFWGQSDHACHYAFNGQERDDELYGAGNGTTSMYWQYDARLGRRWNVDPVDIPGINSYSVMNGNPIVYMDPNGALATKNRPGPLKKALWWLSPTRTRWGHRREFGVILPRIRMRPPADWFRKRGDERYKISYTRRSSAYWHTTTTNNQNYTNYSINVANMFQNDPRMGGFTFAGVRNVTQYASKRNELPGHVWWWQALTNPIFIYTKGIYRGRLKHIPISSSGFMGIIPDMAFGPRGIRTDWVPMVLPLAPLGNLLNYGVPYGIQEGIRGFVSNFLGGPPVTISSYAIIGAIHMGLQAVCPSPALHGLNALDITVLQANRSAQVQVQTRIVVVGRRRRSPVLDGALKKFWYTGRFQ